jgi:hypothetical protein
MPLRIMSWNIQDLSIGKLMGLQEVQEYIADSVHERDASIFVVQEVETALPHPACGRGYVVAPTSGGPAVLALLEELRQINNQWSVVPPLLSGTGGKKEGIAVFFRSDRVNFRGPNQLDTTTIGPKQKRYQWSAGIGGPASTYDVPWTFAVPAELPEGAPIGNPALRQDQLAGKTIFPNPAQPLTTLDFPTPDCRSPFYTEFIEVENPKRLINILSVHLPPRTNIASGAIQNIIRLPEVKRELAANEVRLVLGDFNLDMLRAGGLAGIQPLVNENIPQGGGNITHFACHNVVAPSTMKSVPVATVEGAMPDLGYMATRFQGGAYVAGNEYPAYDAIFVAYGANAAALPPQGFVMNRVVGTPWNAPVVPEAMSHPGGIEAILNWNPWWPPFLLPPPTRDEVFRRIENYGKIRGTSDHIAVYVDV